MGLAARDEQLPMADYFGEKLLLGLARLLLGVKRPSAPCRGRTASSSCRANEMGQTDKEIKKAIDSKPEDTAAQEQASFVWLHAKQWTCVKCT
jgi:hypothetical protein